MAEEVEKCRSNRPIFAGAVNITGRWAPTLSGSRVLLKNDRKSGILAFATAQFLQLVTETVTITTHGTFMAFPYPFEQLC